ncbi:hypothetical protein SLS55_008223 [Diplodia seriata]|uniref:Neutral protease 2 n=1 Tax=Diplodia seriata TaxID=420778 RepID=A0ABR3C9U9_9PEZI
MKLILQLCLLALATVAACGAIDVQLSSVGRTLMQAVITNTGQGDLNLFNKATLLGDAPVQKVSMASHGTLLPFEGIRFTPPGPGNYTTDFFTHLPTGNSLTVRFDAAEEYDLTPGGNFTVVAIGSIPYAEGTSTLLKGDTVAFHSNTIEIKIGRLVNDTVLTARSRFQSLTTDIYVASSCEGDLGQRVEDAIIGDGGCTHQADAAAEDARKEETTELFEQFFHTDDKVQKDRVAARFDAIADQCEVIEQGQTKFHCEDVLGFCFANPVEWSVAYAFDQYHIICLCDLAFNLPALTDKCRELDLTGVVIHELAHLSTVLDPPARDYAYGYPDSANLESEKAVENADTYRYYAQAIALDCPVESATTSESSTESATSAPTAK